MAYVSQEEKAELAPKIKAVLAKYKLKGSIAVDNNSTLVLTIREGPLDFISNCRELAMSKPNYTELMFKDRKYMQVNEYHIQNNYTGVPRDCLLELRAAMQGPGWFDHTDISTDYFNCSHYVNINVGRWDKPYILTKG